MNSIKKEALDYGDNRIKLMREKCQEVADWMTEKVFGMSYYMATEVKNVRAYEYNVSEANTLIHKVNEMETPQQVLDLLHKRLDFYYKRMQQYSENGDFVKSTSDNDAFTQRSKGTYLGIEQTYSSLKAFMMRMVDQGLLQKVDGTNHEYKLIEK